MKGNGWRHIHNAGKKDARRQAPAGTATSMFEHQLKAVHCAFERSDPEPVAATATSHTWHNAWSGAIDVVSVCVLSDVLYYTAVLHGGYT